MDHSIRNQSECYSGKTLGFEDPQITSQMIDLLPSLPWPEWRQIGSQGFPSVSSIKASLCVSSCKPVNCVPQRLFLTS